MLPDAPWPKDHKGILVSCKGQMQAAATVKASSLSFGANSMATQLCRT